MRENSLLTLKEGLDEVTFIPGGPMQGIRRSIMVQSHATWACVEHRPAPIFEKGHHLLGVNDFFGANGITCEKDVEKINFFLSSVNDFIQELGIANDKYVFFVRGSCVTKAFFDQDTDIFLRNKNVYEFLSAKAIEEEMSWFSGPNVDLYIEFDYQDYVSNLEKVIGFIEENFDIAQTTELPNGVTIISIDGFEVPFNIVIRHNVDHKLEWKQPGDHWKRTSNPENARDSVSMRLDSCQAEIKVIGGKWQVALKDHNRMNIQYEDHILSPKNMANFMRILRFNLIWPIKEKFAFDYLENEKKEVGVGSKDYFIANLLTALFIDIRGVKDFFDLMPELKEFLPLLNFEQLTASVIDELDKLRDDLEVYLSLLVKAMVFSGVDDVKNTNAENSFLQLINALNAVDENQTVPVAPKSII